MSFICMVYFVKQKTKSSFSRIVRKFYSFIDE